MIRKRLSAIPGLVLVLGLLLMSGCSAINQPAGGKGLDSSPSPPSGKNASADPVNQTAASGEKASEGSLPWRKEDPQWPLISRLAASPDDAQAWFELSKIQFRMGHRYAAWISAERALALAPDRSEYLVQFGWTCVNDPGNCNMFGRGLDALRKAISLAPDDRSVRLLLAHAYELSPRVQEAVPIYEALAKGGDQRAKVCLALLRPDTQWDLDGDGQNETLSFAETTLLLKRSGGGQSRTDTRIPEHNRRISTIDIGALQPVLWISGDSESVLYMWDSSSGQLKEIYRASSKTANFDQRNRALVLYTPVSGGKGMRTEVTWKEDGVRENSYPSESFVGFSSRPQRPEALEHLVAHLALYPSQHLFLTDELFQLFDRAVKKKVALESPLSGLQVMPTADLSGTVLIAVNGGRPATSWPVTLIHDQGWIIRNLSDQPVGPVDERSVMPWSEGHPHYRLMLHVAAHPADSEGWYRLSQAQLQSGVRYAARVSAERALAIEPDRVEYLVQFGLACVQDESPCNKDGRGYSALKRAADLAPKDPNPLLLLAQSYEAGRQVALAAPVYQRLVELGHSEAHLPLKLLRDESRWDLDGDGKNEQIASQGRLLTVTANSGTELLRLELSQEKSSVQVIDLGARFPVLWIQSGNDHWLYGWTGEGRTLTQLLQVTKPIGFYDPLNREFVTGIRINRLMAGTEAIRWQEGGWISRSSVLVGHGLGIAGAGPTSVEHLALLLAMSPGEEELFTDREVQRTFQGQIARFVPKGEVPSVQILPTPDARRMLLVLLRDGKPVAEWPVDLENDRSWRLGRVGNGR